MGPPAQLRGLLESQCAGGRGGVSGEGAGKAVGEGDCAVIHPAWLDQRIQTVLASGNAEAIARAIAEDPNFVDAIRRGLLEVQPDGRPGPSNAQRIAAELMKLFSPTP
jgi:hypothetical protein